MADSCVVPRAPEEKIDPDAPVLWEVASEGFSAEFRASAVWNRALSAAWPLWRDAHIDATYKEFLMTAKVLRLTPLPKPPPMPLLYPQPPRWPQGGSGYRAANCIRGEEIVSVYVMRCGPFIKVGITQQPWLRLRAMQGGCPYRICIASLRWVHAKNAAGIERAAMNALRKHHRHGEWFHCGAKLGDYAMGMAVQRAGYDQAGLPEPEPEEDQEDED